MARVNLGRIKTVFKGEWSTTSAYVIDDIVKNGGGLYICNADHIAGDFATDSANWEAYTSGVAWKGAHDVAVQYNPGEMVSFGGSSYIALTTNTGEDVTTSADWDRTTSGVEYTGMWAPSTDYVVDQLVTSAGSTYVCILNHTSANAFVIGTEWILYAAGGDIALNDNDQNGKFLMSNGTTTQWEGIDLQNGFKDTAGFDKDGNETSTLAFDNATRTFTITPTGTDFAYYVEGVKHLSTGDSIQIPDITGQWKIFYDVNGNIAMTKEGGWDTIEDLILHSCVISILYWDSVNQEQIYIGNERHGKDISPTMHLYLHTTAGLTYSGGLALQNIDVDQDGTDSAHAQFGVQAGRVMDEDIKIDIANVATSVGIPVWHRDSDGWHATKNAGQQVRTFDNTPNTRLCYNEILPDGTFKLTEADNGMFVFAHVFATTGVNEPVKVVMGRAQYLTCESAAEHATSEVKALVDMAFLPETKILGSVIYQTADSYTNNIKSIIVSTPEGLNYVDSRTVVITDVAVATSSHNDMSGLLSNDHPQYSLRGYNYLNGDTEVWSGYGGYTFGSKIITSGGEPFTGTTSDEWDATYPYTMGTNRTETPIVKASNDHYYMLTNANTGSDPITSSDWEVVPFKASNKGVWNDSTVYPAGIFVQAVEGGVWYFSIAETTNNEPVTDTAAWSTLTTEQAEDVVGLIDSGLETKYKGAWTEQTYVQGDIVYYFSTHHVYSNWAVVPTDTNERPGHTMIDQNQRFLCDTSAGSWTFTVPDVPHEGLTDGDTLEFVDYAGTWGTNPLYVEPHVNSILGSTDTLECDVSGTNFKLIYIAATNNWILA